MTYQRRTIWGEASPLTSADLNAEFDAIAAAIQGLVAAAGGTPDTTGSLALVVNAGDSAFNPSGTASFATRVAEAIAFAATVNRKVVWVPRFMWGYVEDAEWSDTMFDAGILVVREGQLFPGYDPIAYGAKIADVAVDNTPVFDVCFDHASTGTGPGAKIVMVTLPGAYQLDTAVVRPVGVGLWEAPGVSYTGSAIDTYPKTLQDIPRAIVAVTESFTETITANSIELHLFGWANAPTGGTWEILSWRLRWQQDGAGSFSEWSYNPTTDPTATLVGEGIFTGFTSDLLPLQFDVQLTQLAARIQNADAVNDADINIEMVVVWGKVA